MEWSVRLRICSNPLFHLRSFQRGVNHFGGVWAYKTRAPASTQSGNLGSKICRTSRENQRFTWVIPQYLRSLGTTPILRKSSGGEKAILGATLGTSRAFSEQLSELYSLTRPKSYKIKKQSILGAILRATPRVGWPQISGNLFLTCKLVTNFTKTVPKFLTW